MSDEIDLLLQPPPPPIGDILPKQRTAYRCKICDSMRSEVEPMQAHVRVHHPEIAPSDRTATISIESIDALLTCKCCGYKAVNLSVSSAHVVSCPNRTEAERRAIAEARSKAQVSATPRTTRKRIYEGDVEVQLISAKEGRTVKYRTVKGSLVPINLPIEDVASLSRALMRASVLHTSEKMTTDAANAAVAALDPTSDKK